MAVLGALLLLGCLLTAGLYHGWLYLLRPTDRAPLVLGAWCALLAVFVATRQAGVVTLLFPSLSLSLSARLSLVSLQLILPLTISLVEAFYPTLVPQWVGRASWGLGAVLALIALIMPESILPGLRVVEWIADAGLAVFIGGMLLQAWRRKLPDARLVLSGAVILGLVALNDFLAFQLSAWPLSDNLTESGLLILVMLLAFSLARRTVRTATTAHTEAEQLTLQVQRLQRLNQAYLRFVPQSFLNLLGKDDIFTVRLGDQAHKTVTVMFAGVRDFTALSENMSPAENFAFINTLFGGLSPIIREHNGFIDQYRGDGLMAIFPRQPEDALRAAMAIGRLLAALNLQQEARNQPQIKFGMGLHVGPMMMGIVGEPEFMDNTVIAEVVRVTSRLDRLTKRFGATVVISEAILTSLHDSSDYVFRALSKIQARGVAEPQTVYEVFAGLTTEQLDIKRFEKPIFEGGLFLYYGRRFAEARDYFKQALALDPHDQAAQLYINRCDEFSQAPLATDWNGAETFVQ